MKNKPSLLDVAKRANVAVSTVSRTINNKGKISIETRDMIKRIMREIGYTPNRVARRLQAKGGRSHLLGLIIPNIRNPFFADLARGVEDMAYENNSAVLLCNYDENPEKEQIYLDVLQAESVDGIILPPIDEHDKAVLNAIKSGLVVVCVDRTLSDYAVDRVIIDNHLAALEAVEHLLRKGHRRIGLVSGPIATSTGRERLAGYRHAHDNAGIPVIDELVCFGDYKEASGRTLVAELLALPDPPSALFVCNSLMTIGALDSVRNRGLSIPEDIAIIGFDDIPLASAFNPPLSVVYQPAYEVGREAARLLFGRLDDPMRQPVCTKLRAELIIRASG